MKFAGMHPEEVPLDAEAITDIDDMFNRVPEIYIARESFLSMTICGPFSFRIPSLGLHSNKDMSLVIGRYWTPWQRKIFDNIKKYGICPYYIEMAGEYPVPVVPEMDSGFITVYMTKKHKLKYTWYWNHGMQQQVAHDMLWVLSDYAPTKTGRIRSALATLLPQYRLLRVIERSLDIAVTQNANPTHVMEYHPSAATAKNDDLTTLSASFGAKVAGAMQQRNDMQRQTEIRVRTKEFMQQARMVHQNNMLNGLATTPKLLWTDTPEDQLQRMNSGFADRLIPLKPDFKYVQAAKPSVVTEYEKHRSAFAINAAACMDYSLEFIQPHGSARTQNIQGSERFENERIKEAISFLTQVTQTALVIAYRKQFEEGFEQARQWRARKGGIAVDVAQNCPEMDVEVNMACTPHAEYEQFKEMWMDGIISKETFAHHAFHMYSMSDEQMNVTVWPDKYPKELLVKPTTTGGAGGGGAKKKKPSSKKKKRARVTATAADGDDDDDEQSSSSSQKRTKQT